MKQRMKANPNLIRDVVTEGNSMIIGYLYVSIDQAWTQACAAGFSTPSELHNASAIHETL